MNKLAIIIPAYKSDYLYDTLTSLANQTCQDFIVYIGDDGSPCRLYTIVKQFSERLNLVYHYFRENVGGSNLIMHWNRCLELMNGEDYFCLFSDDDLMAPNCVANFYEELQLGESYDVYHYDMDIIDREGKLLNHCPVYPHILSSSSFFELLYSSKIDARMPEFIFRTDHFKKVGGFVEFDLAYRSDNATVMVCAEECNIYTINGAKVFWRDSGLNISSGKNESGGICKRKVLATIVFFNWLSDYYKSLEKNIPFSLKWRLRFLLREIVSLYPALPDVELYDMLSRINSVNTNWGINIWCRLKLARKIKRVKREKKLSICC